MNAERLLAQFEPISEAPDAIARLRRFILDLAVRGKLVEQDPEDEPAEELLRLINLEKALHTSNARSQKSSLPELPELEELPFCLPVSWRWVPATYPASSVSEGDKKIQTKEVLETGAYPVVDQGKVFIRGYCNDSSKVIRVEEPLILFGDHTRETKFIDFDFVVGADGVKLLKPIGIHPQYYFLTLRWLPLDSRGYGRHFKLLRSSVIPLPPLAEQHRIVAKVDELMALCDQLEAARQERDQGRERLVAATLQRLNQPADDPGSFRNDARFALQVLPSLTTTPAQIKQLRQTILNLAVRGKLVEQDPEDEPAEELSRQISLERKWLAKTGVISLKKPPIRDPARFIENLPEAWSQLALGELCNLVTSGSRGWAEFYSESGVGFIRAQNIRFGCLRLGDMAHIQLPPNSEGSRTRVEAGDLLVVITGAGVTNPALLDRDIGEAYVSQHVGLIRPTHNSLSPWLLLCLMAPSGGRNELVERAYGAGKPGLNLDNIRSLTLPLPPLAEQHRIVAKVDELMALCDQLEMQLSQADQQRRRLLEALLAEALVEPQKMVAGMTA